MGAGQGREWGVDGGVALGRDTQACLGEGRHRIRPGPGQNASGRKHPGGEVGSAQAFLLGGRACSLLKNNKLCSTVIRTATVNPGRTLMLAHQHVLVNF